MQSGRFALALQPLNNRLVFVYREYKENYANCKTLQDSYDSVTRTILVLVPKEKDALP